MITITSRYVNPYTRYEIRAMKMSTDRAGRKQKAAKRGTTTELQGGWGLVHC